MKRLRTLSLSLGGPPARADRVIGLEREPNQWRLTIGGPFSCLAIAWASWPMQSPLDRISGAQFNDVHSVIKKTGAG